MALLTPHRINALSLHGLLLHELKDLYDAEQQLVESIPRMIEAAHEPALKQALAEHLEETKLHVNRLEDCFEMLNEEPKRETCDGMKGLLKEADHLLKGEMDAAVMDEAIIAAAQRIEHYEISAYGSARAHAMFLDIDDVGERLNATLQEEAAADKTLTRIAHQLYRELASAQAS